MPMMKAILSGYRMDQQDLDHLREVGEFLIPYKEDMADKHYAAILQNSELQPFFKESEKLERARLAFLGWFEDIFNADYSYKHYLKLSKIGGVHVRIGLPAYHVNVLLSQVREYVAEKVISHYADNPSDAMRYLNSVNKALDLNLDIMTRSYREEELKENFISYKLDSLLITIARRFLNGFNFALVLGLMVIGVLALGMAVYDMLHIMDNNSLARGTLAALGSVLILWVVIELLDTQIRHIKGKVFAIKIFVTVALVAELRQVLIGAIEHRSWVDSVTISGAVLSLGIVYWLISKIENS